MQMIVIEQRLALGMQHRRNPQLDAETVLAKLQERLTHRPEEQPLDGPLVLLDESVQGMR